jgi:hypothetical protein
MKKIDVSPLLNCSDSNGEKRAARIFVAPAHCIYGFSDFWVHSVAVLLCDGGVVEVIDTLYLLGYLNSQENPYTKRFFKNLFEKKEGEA